jgi:hypothetical protein
MRIRLVALAATLAIATPLVAAVERRSTEPEQALVTAGSYTPISGDPLIEWQVDHYRISPYFGCSATQRSRSIRRIPPPPGTTSRISVSKVVANPGLTGHLLRRPRKPAASPISSALFVSTKVVARGHRHHRRPRSTCRSTARQSYQRQGKSRLRSQGQDQAQ